MRGTRRGARTGITLTEILIAIMIMGIGMVSVATLFPIGLLRMRDATRFSRSTLLTESAKAEAARSLLLAESFTALQVPWYGPWRTLGKTPMTKDFNVGNEAANPGVEASTFTPGLPVAYDPLFWSTLHYQNPGAAVGSSVYVPGLNDPTTRFGSGIGFIRQAGNTDPPAHGLQRITNFIRYSTGTFWPLTYSMPSTPSNLASIAEVAGEVFSSLDDPVVQEAEGAEASGSPLIPTDFNPQPPDQNGLNVAYQRDYNFTWMVTARQASAGDTSTYEADIVVFHNRPIGLEPVPAPFDPSGTRLAPIGERVVEAVWGYTGSPSSVVPRPVGYSTADDRVVLLRWHRDTPDPNVPVGSYIADVTYERYQTRSAANYNPSNSRYSGQRIHWYRVVQRGEAEDDPDIANHRRMIVRIDTPVKAKTRLQVNGNTVVPVIPEAALLNEYVVNVHSTLLHAR